MNILFIGDVVGQKSCANLREKLPLLKKEYNIDTVIVNGENSADGNGITPVTAKYLLESGADVITTGNHCFRRKEMDAFYETSDFVIRPANFPDDVVGKGYTILDHGRYSVCVINLMGVVDTWLLYPEMAASMDGIPNHFNALLQRRAGNDRSIGEKEQFIVSRYLHHGQMGQNLSFRQQTMFLVQNGT